MSDRLAASAADNPAESLSLRCAELFKPPKPCFMGNGSTLILRVMPDVRSTLRLLYFMCDSNHGARWNPFWMLVIQAISWNIHLICGTCERHVCHRSKNKTFSPRFPERGETAWNVHITQVAERNSLNINMASLHVLTLNSFMLFKVWNAVNAMEMDHENSSWRPHMLNIIDNALIPALINLISWPGVEPVYNMETCFSLGDKPAVHSGPVRMKGAPTELWQHMLTVHPRHNLSTFWRSGELKRGN